MMKHLLSCAAIAAMALTANAAEVTLWEGSCNFGTAWGESFAVPAADLAVLDNTAATLKFIYTTNADGEYAQFKPCSNGAGWTPLAVATELGNDYQCITVEMGSTSYDLPLAAADIATIKADGLRVQGYNMTVTKVVYDSDKEIDENLLWEGSLEVTGWSVQGPVIASSKVKAGDILKYELSAAGAESGQILMKGSDWSNLLGTFKINQKDMAGLSFEVGVTQEMLDNCGGQIFFQGEGGSVFTKISKAGTFEADGVIAYGTRQPGVQVFATIPEGTEKIAVEFATVPGWSQFANKSWADLELANSIEGTVVTYTLTPAAIATVNADKEFIINSDAAVNKVYIPTGDSKICDVIAAEASAVNVYDLSGRLVRAGVNAAEAADGLPAGFYIVGSKKVVVR